MTVDLASRSKSAEGSLTMFFEPGVKYPRLLARAPHSVLKLVHGLERDISTYHFFSLSPFEVFIRLLSGFFGTKGKHQIWMRFSCTAFV